MWCILGAGGQLGKCLEDLLRRRGIPHRALHRSECDITNADALATALAGFPVSVLVNAAAWTAVDAAEDHEEQARLVNENGAHNIAQWCLLHSATLVHISTDYVFDGLSNRPIPEDSECIPTTAYGRTKLAGEKAVINSGLESFYIVRTAWLYSEHGKNFVKTMVGRATSNSPVNVVCDQLGQPTNAHDLALHILNLVDAGLPFGIYHGTNSGQASWFELASEIYRLVGVGAELVTPVSSESYPTRARRPSYSVLGHNKTGHFGLTTMRPWKIALAESIEAIAEQVGREAV